MIVRIYGPGAPTAEAVGGVANPFIPGSVIRHHKGWVLVIHYLIHKRQHLSHFTFSKFWDTSGRERCKPVSWNILNEQSNQEESDLLFDELGS